MAFGIYKPGQGYWVRMMSAVGFGLLVIAGVVWLWGELDTVGGKTTIVRGTTEFAMRLTAWGQAQKQEVAAMQGLRDILLDDSQGQARRHIRLTDTQSHVYTLDPASFDAAVNYQAPGLPPLGAHDSVRIAQVEKLSISGDHLTFTGIPSFTYRNKLYIQSATAVGVILVFGGLLFWALNKPRVADFMIATETEMAKVSWPTKREVVGSTWVVICGTFMMAGLLLLVDMVFSELFISIHVLEGKSLLYQLLGL